MTTAPAPLFGLHVIAPPYTAAIPSATSSCGCGYQRHARGKRQVLDLIDAYTQHQTACPRRRSAQPVRRAA